MNPPSEITDFNSLPLSPALLGNLDSLGYTSMTPIQAQALPQVLAGRDLLAQAQTVSGKTAAFGIGLLTRLNPRLFGVQGLVLCPTRELADQVTKELRRLARATPNIKLVTLVGGMAAILLSLFLPEIIAPFAHGVPMAEAGSGLFAGMTQYKYMRAFFGVVVCAVLAVGTALFTRAEPPERRRGLVSGESTSRRG